MTKSPATPLIEASASTPWISGSFNLKRFETAKVELENAVNSGKVWNVDWESWKYDIAQGTEHAQKVGDNQFQDEVKDSKQLWTSDDPRYDIGYAFQMNQAAPLLKRLKKLPADKVTPGLQHYMDVLAEVASVNDWLKSIKAMNIIVKGRKPNPNAPPPDTTNMGECSCCGKDQKLMVKDGTIIMAHHGFTISDGAGHYFGYREGSCPGVKFPPYELSCEGNKFFLKGLQNGLAQLKKRLAELQDGKVTEISQLQEIREAYGKYRRELVKYTPEHKDWAKVLQNEVLGVDRQIEFTDYEIKVQEERISKWQLKPIVFRGNTVNTPKIAGFDAKFLQKH